MTRSTIISSDEAFAMLNYKTSYCAIALLNVLRPTFHEKNSFLTKWQADQTIRHNCSQWKIFSRRYSKTVQDRKFTILKYYNNTAAIVNTGNSHLLALSIRVVFHEFQLYQIINLERQIVL